MFSPSLFSLIHISLLLTFLALFIFRLLTSSMGYAQCCSSLDLLTSLPPHCLKFPTINQHCDLKNFWFWKKN
jgi:hypothetical protein